MKKWGMLVFLVFFPLTLFADTSSLSFAPPVTDYSVVFLGNLFGIVDGVLHSSGSQMMGAIFSVFNSAVLALGGIIIMYTLLVSTMNTAHEGQMLGQKWSSIWVPMRSTLGLALLMPKASGYCLMQIFVMWVVVQGVGAADKVWEAALSYLNRGGVIIQSQPSSGDALINLINGQANAIPNAANTILLGQVCMLAIQKQLETQRELDIAKGGRCQSPLPNQIDPGPLCSGAVPDFLGTINFVTAQQDQKPATSFKVSMPNFSTTTGNEEYASLNGICGSVTWKAISQLSGTAQTGVSNTLSKTTTINIFGMTKTSNQTAVTLSASEFEAAQLSRAIAIQQMYVDLSTVAQIMVNNDPQINASSSNDSSSTNTPYSTVATQQFGVPYTTNSSYCTSYASGCTNWGPYALTTGTNSSNASVLFNGSEFAGAITDYNGIIKPTLNLIQAIQAGSSSNKAREFINQANQQGWIMAGAYFFNLVKLNGNATRNANTTDTNSGLEGSTSFTMGSFSTPSTALSSLLQWLNGNQKALNQISDLFQGGSSSGSSTTASVVSPFSFAGSINTKNLTLITGANSSTVFGFIKNSLLMQSAAQPGLSNLSFDNVMKVTADNKMYYMQQIKFDCGKVKTFMFSFCLGQLMGNVFYNGIMYVIYNALIFFFQQIITQIVMAFLMVPLQGMSSIFQDGISTLSKAGANPIVALSQMGQNYINFSGSLWIILMFQSISAALIPLFGIFIFSMMMFVMPLILAWVGIMVSIGFVTSYYIPILPYMIFTFGAVAWFIAVIEAMVAAPIVALGITHPEGHDAFGKGEAAIMLLMNIFLRPAMMIIGYIAAISLSYVGVWLLNAGYDQAISFIQTGDYSNSAVVTASVSNYGTSATGVANEAGAGTGGYDSWAGIYSFFFSILLYTTMYLTIVQNAFSLISYLPHKVLSWIGGNPESLGTESARWGDENVKGKIGEAGGKTFDAQGQVTSKVGAKVMEKGKGAASFIAKIPGGTMGAQGGKD